MLLVHITSVISIDSKIVQCWIKLNVFGKSSSCLRGPFANIDQAHSRYQGHMNLLKPSKYPFFSNRSTLASEHLVMPITTFDKLWLAPLVGSRFASKLFLMHPIIRFLLFHNEKKKLSYYHLLSLDRENRLIRYDSLFVNFLIKPTNCVVVACGISNFVCVK